MLRSFIDEADEMRVGRCADIDDLSCRLDALNERVLVVCGEAAQGVFETFCTLFRPLGLVTTLAIHNDYFGGNVNVTGLICSCDLLAQLPVELTGVHVLLPEVMFNYDGLTLDGDTRSHIACEVRLRGGVPHFATPAPNLMLDAMLD